MLGFTILNVKASANDSKTVISGGRDDQGGLSDAKFGTLRRFSKESAELPSLSNGCNQIAQDHSRARSAQLNRGILMGAKEFAVAPRYLLKVLRALPWVCGYRGHLDIE